MSFLKQAQDGRTDQTNRRRPLQMRSYDRRLRRLCTTGWSKRWTLYQWFILM